MISTRGLLCYRPAARYMTKLLGFYTAATPSYSRVQDRDDEGDEHLAGDEEYFQVNYASKWLEQIGSQFSRLKKVIIDANTMCTQDGCLCGERIEFLPLLRLIWKNPDFLKVISFGDASKIPYTPDAVNEAVGRDGGWNNKAYMLNNMLTALAVEDVLDIRKYSFSTRLMSAVSIIARPEEDENSYVCMGNGSEEECVEFLVSDKGKPLRWKPQEERPRLGNLPTDIRERIAGLVLRHPEGVTIDLDTHTIRGLNLGLDRIRLVNRSTLGSIASHVNYVTLKMTSNKTITKFDRFEKLDRLLVRRINSSEAVNALVGSHLESNPQTIILEIAPTEVTTLGAIRINIKELMKIVLHERQTQPDSTIRITLTPPPDTGAPQQFTTISTEKLQRQAFLVLSESMSQRVEQLRVLPGVTIAETLLKVKTPDLWIDGYGNLLDIPTPETGTSLIFTYSKLSIKELGILGYSRATTLDWIYKAFREADTYGRHSGECVVPWWGYMRMKLYGDWDFGAPPPGLKKFGRLDARLE